MENTMTNEVIQNRKVDTCGTSRCGTYEASPADLIRVLGEPHETDGDKTTMEWYFETPDGPATLYDYWWNRPGEWSIGGYSNDAAEHLVKHLDSLLGR